MSMSSSEPKGFTLLHRKIFQNDFLLPKGHVYTRFEAWCDIYNQLAWPDGQFEASLNILADRWNWSRSKTRRFLKALENRDLIVKCPSADNSPTLFLVVDYGKYLPHPLEF